VSTNAIKERDEVSQKYSKILNNIFVFWSAFSWEKGFFVENEKMSRQTRHQITHGEEKRSKIGQKSVTNYLNGPYIVNMGYYNLMNSSVQAKFVRFIEMVHIIDDRL
jgi:hypothetical protein